MGTGPARSETCLGPLHPADGPGMQRAALRDPAHGHQVLRRRMLEVDLALGAGFPRQTQRFQGGLLATCAKIGDPLKRNPSLRGRTIFPKRWQKDSHEQFHMAVGPKMGIPKWVALTNRSKD